MVFFLYPFLSYRRRINHNSFIFRTGYSRVKSAYAATGSQFFKLSLIMFHCALAISLQTNARIWRISLSSSALALQLNSLLGSDCTPICSYNSVSYLAPNIPGIGDGALACWNHFIAIRAACVLGVRNDEGYLQRRSLADKLQSPLAKKAKYLFFE